MFVRLTEVFIPQGSTIGLASGTDEDGKHIWIAGDWRPMADLDKVVQREGEVLAEAEAWQVITDMSLVCETLDEHDFKAEDIADGVVGGGAAHVMAIYCTRCGAEGGPEDIE